MHDALAAYFLAGLSANVTAALWVKFVKDVLGLTATQIGAAVTAYLLSPPYPALYWGT